MTRHPIAQIAPNGNLKSQEIRRRRCHFLRNRLLQSPRFARPLNARAILHGRLFCFAVRRCAGTKPFLLTPSGGDPLHTQMTFDRRAINFLIPGNVLFVCKLKDNFRCNRLLLNTTITHRRNPYGGQKIESRRWTVTARSFGRRPVVLPTRRMPGEGDAREVRFPRPTSAPAARNMSSRRPHTPDGREQPGARTNPGSPKVAVPAQWLLPFHSRKA
jgi:hypothetical protein